MIIKILIAVAVVVVLFVIIVAMRPSEFSVTRSKSIHAPPDAVFAQVNDLHKWEAWSPWAKVDPNAKTKYDGPGAGVGAAFWWSGNNMIGEGRMSITESRLNELVRFKLDFERPMKGTSDADFVFRPEGNQTMVSWTMSGKNNFIAKAVGLFMSCDKMIGGQFEKGLADMKSVVEQKTAVQK